MTLEDWRRAEGLSYQALAKRLGVTSATIARRYALGIVEIPPEAKETILSATSGAVTLSDLHRQRLDHTRHKFRSRTLRSGLPMPDRAAPS